MYRPRAYDKDREERAPNIQTVYNRPDDRAGRPDDRVPARYAPRERSASPRRSGVAGPSVYTTSPYANVNKPTGLDHSHSRRISDSAYRAPVPDSGYRSAGPVAPVRGWEGSRPGGSPSHYASPMDLGEIREPPGAASRYPEARSEPGFHKERDGPMGQPLMRDAAVRDVHMRDAPVRDVHMRDVSTREAPMRDLAREALAASQSTSAREGNVRATGMRDGPSGREGQPLEGSPKSGPLPRDGPVRDGPSREGSAPGKGRDVARGPGTRESTPRNTGSRESGKRQSGSRDVHMRDVSRASTRGESHVMTSEQSDAADLFMHNFILQQRAMKNLMQAKDNLKQFEDLKLQCPDDARQRADLDAKVQTKKDELVKAEKNIAKRAASTTASLRDWMRATGQGMELQGGGGDATRQASNGESSSSNGVTNGASSGGQAPVAQGNGSTGVAPGVAINAMNNNAAPTLAGPSTNGNAAAHPTNTASTTPATTVPAADPISPATKNRKLKAGVARDIEGLKVSVDNLITTYYNVEDNANDRAQKLQEELDETTKYYEEEIADVRKIAALERKARKRDRANAEERDAARTAEIQSLRNRVSQAEQMMKRMEEGLKSLRDVTERAKVPLGLAERLGPMGGG